MCSWHDHLAELLLPIYQPIAARMRESDYIKVDETPVRCLEPGAGKTASGYFRVYHHAEHGVLFDWHKSRAHTCLDHILIERDGERSFNGHFQSHGLSRLPHLHRTPPEVRDHSSLLPHPHHPQIQGSPRRTSTHRRAHPASDRQHLSSRETLVCRERRPSGSAAHAGTNSCITDGQIEFDNNLTENAIRLAKLGHKNWLFIGGEHTGWHSAVIYTFVEQVRRHGADPFAFFEWVFEKLKHHPAPEELEALLPANGIKTRLAASQTIKSRIA
jgi:transposase